MEPVRTTQLTLRLSEDLLEQVRREARERGQMSVAAYVRLALMEKLERDGAARGRLTRQAPPNCP